MGKFNRVQKNLLLGDWTCSQWKRSRVIGIFLFTEGHYQYSSSCVSQSVYEFLFMDDAQINMCSSASKPVFSYTSCFLLQTSLCFQHLAVFGSWIFSSAQRITESLSSLRISSSMAVSPIVSVALLWSMLLLVLNILYQVKFMKFSCLLLMIRMVTNVHTFSVWLHWCGCCLWIGWLSVILF